MPNVPSVPRVSVVVPVYNEAENVLPLLAEIQAALGVEPYEPYEVVFVDDCSEDETAARLAPHLGERVRLVRHGRRSGQSAAVRTGVMAARAGWIATLDGDGQNDPADLPRLLDTAWNGEGSPALVGGIRIKRRDTLSKRIATRVANGLRQAILADGCPDTGCGIKVFRRDVFLGLPFFGAMHRFLPALFQIHQARVAFVPVNHRPRQRGVSKYGNLSRGLVGIVDLLGVLWLKWRTKIPGSIQEDTREDPPAVKAPH